MKNSLKVLLGALVLALAGGVYAAVTINGDACGNLSGNVSITPGGDVIINTDNTLCGYNRGSTGEPPPPPPPTTTWNLTVAASNGSVSRSATGTSCGTGCFTYNDGTSVVLTANPSSGYTFAGWSGACTNTSGTCTVSMTANRSVTANFSPVVAQDGCPTPYGSVNNQSYPSQSVVVRLGATEILSYPLPKTANGRISVVKNLSENNGWKFMTVSTCPGDMTTTGKERGCYNYGIDDATIFYTTGSGSSTNCSIAGNETYYVNISHVSFSGRSGCNSSTCGFTVR